MKEMEESKIYDNSSGIHYCIDKAIKEKKRIFIDYYSEYNDESTSREISPIKKYKYKSNNYLQAYCHKRKAERNFLTKSIESATEMNKKKTKIKLGKPNTKIIEKMKQENNPYKANDNTQNYVREYKKDLKRNRRIFEFFWWSNYCLDNYWNGIKLTFWLKMSENEKKKQEDFSIIENFISH